MSRPPTIDASYLGQGFSREKEGFYAEFYPDGQLKHFGFYEDGSCERYTGLYLEHGKERGKTKYSANGFYEEYTGGAAQRFDWWSDNEEPRRLSFERWVQEWIETIYQTVPFACSFCGLRQKDVTTLVSSSHGHFICDGCTEQCMEMIIENRVLGRSLRGSQGEGYCDFCGKGQGEVDQLVTSEEGVRICDACVEVAVQIVSPDDESEAE